MEKKAKSSHECNDVVSAARQQAGELMIEKKWHAPSVPGLYGRSDQACGNVVLI